MEEEVNAEAQGKDQQIKSLFDANNLRESKLTTNIAEPPD